LTDNSEQDLEGKASADYDNDELTGSKEEARRKSRQHDRVAGVSQSFGNELTRQDEDHAD